MKFKPIQILWHNKLPIFTLDFEPQEPFRLATGGGDQAARIWKLNYKQELPVVEFLASLNRHTGSVNCVRWMQSILATAGDDGSIILWKQNQQQQQQSTSASQTSFGQQEEEEQLEQWIPYIILPGTHAIYDLAWSPKGDFIACCSDMDNGVRIWHTESKKQVKALNDHVHFVQGVSWSPNGKNLATQASDRAVHYYNCVMPKEQQKLNCSLYAKSSKLEMKFFGKVDSEGKTFYKLYHDETMVSFFRRLCFSPDGLLLCCPAGLIPSEEKQKNHCIYIYAANAFKSGPILSFPGFRNPATVIRFSPVQYQLKEQKKIMDVDYYYIFAVAAFDCVFLFSTQKSQPVAILEHLHYAGISDLSWSKDGQQLLISSLDGFCSIVCFEEGELGKPLSIVEK